MSRFLLGCLLVASCAQSQENWPRFRGANGAGAADSVDVPVEWTDANTLWRVELAGGGHGSPVVWDGRVYLLVSDGPGVLLVCRDAQTGAELWTASHEGQPVHRHALNSSAAGTPAVDASGVYVSWADGEDYNLAGYSHEGKELWRNKLGPYVSSHGYSRSPIIVDGHVVLASNQQSRSFVAAFKPSTGDQVWNTSLPAGIASYGTPCVIDTPSGVKAIVTCSSESAVHAFDADQGELLWKMDDVLPQRNVASPIHAGGLLLVTSGNGGGGKLLAAIEPPSARGVEPRLVYSLTKAVPYVPTPLVVGDLLILWHDRGTVSGFDLASGDKLWEKRIGGKCFCSPIAVGGLVLAVTMDGEAIILNATRVDCEVVARNDLGEPTEATPAVANGRLYVSTDSSLTCIGPPTTAVSEQQKVAKKTTK